MLLEELTVYELLNNYQLYNDISNIIYHLKISYLPASSVIKKIAPHKNLSLQESAKLIYKNIKLCDIASPLYNADIDEELTKFGTNYLQPLNKQTFKR